MGIRSLFWVCAVVILGGCHTTSKIKVTADIDKQGEVNYHTEYEVEF